MTQRRFAWTALTLLVLAGASAPAAAPHPGERTDAGFELRVVPPLETPVGPLTCSTLDDINDKGHATGKASRCGTNTTAAIRFTAAGELQDLDPNGRYRSFGFAIDRRGTVLGFTSEGSGFSDGFVHRRRTGFDFLEKGKTDAIRSSFIPGFGVRQGLPRAGDVLGAVLSSVGNAALPYLYTRREGWVDLSALHPRFVAEPTIGAYQNEVGYRVFVISGTSPPGETPPTGRQDYFVLSPDGTLTAVVSPGRPVTPGSRPTRGGRMSGLYLTANARARAYVWERRTGLVDIHPDGFRESFAHGTNERGVTFGVLARKRVYGDLFVHTDRDGLEIVVSRRDLKELSRGRRGRFELLPVDMNDRGEILACVTTRAGADFSIYYSPETGLFALNEVLAGLETGYRERGCAAAYINNRGEILLSSISNGARSAGAVLQVPD